MSEEQDSQEQHPTEAEFHYIKAPSYRVIHADGAWGGVTPQGKICMAVFSERPAIPQRIVIRLGKEGEPPEEILEKREGKGGIIREVESAIIMDVNVAGSIIAWLQERVDMIDIITKQRENPDG